MATESFPVNEAITRLRFTHPDGKLTRDAIFFLIAMFQRLGGANGPSIPDIIISIEGLASNPQAPTVGEASSYADVVAQVDSLNQQNASLRAEMAEMQKQIDGIRQGYTL
jgi:hypothetical protein